MNAVLLRNNHRHV